jgi:hypothetical protein
MTARVGDEESFAQARGRAEMAHLVVVRDDGQQVVLPALPSNSVSVEMVAQIEKIVPSGTKRSIAVIAETHWAAVPSPTLQEASDAIPFFGILMGLAYIGHVVWVFSGTGNSFAAGCRAADVLIVDSAVTARLPIDWKAEARQVMRNPQIVIHDRDAYRLRAES